MSMADDPGSTGPLSNAMRPILNRERYLRTLRTLLAQDCMLCDSPSGDVPVCAACAQSLAPMPPHCPVCAMPGPGGVACGACIAHPPAFDATVAAWPYRFPLDRLVQALKFHARLQLAPWFAAALAHRLEPTDVVIGMPLHRGRLAERGFNQAHEIARALAACTGMPLAGPGLRRVRATQEQSHMPLEMRARNVRGAFACEVPLRGQSITVVDDVMTTGATLRELAGTLKRAGAARVVNCVVARTLL
jgi:ComF family protein